MNLSTLKTYQRLLDAINIDLRDAIPTVSWVQIMEVQKEIPQEEIQMAIKENEIENIVGLIDNDKRWNDPRLESTSSGYMRYPKRCRYVKYDKDTESETSVVWENIHGKHRKTAKFLCKKGRKRIINNFNTFNKYVGRDDVVCLNLLINTFNKYSFAKDLTKHPAFIEWVSGGFDADYCDMYFKIDPQLIKDCLRRLQKGEI